MRSDRFFIIARNMTIVIGIGLIVASLVLSSLMLYKVSMIALGLTVVFGSRVDSEKNSKLNRKIGPWLGGLLSVSVLCHIIYEIIKNR